MIFLVPAPPPVTLGSKKLNRTFTYLALFLALLASQLLMPAYGQPLAPANTMPLGVAGLNARAREAFANFHFHSAERDFVSALAQTSGKDDQLAAIEIMQKLARTHELLCQYDQAEKNLATAVFWSENLPDQERSAQLASSLSKLGALDLSMANYKNARAELGKCLALAGNDTAGSGIKAKVLNTIAELDLAQGNWVKARENADSCLALTESAFGKQSLEYAQALNTSAMSNLYLGHEVEALTELASSLAYCEAAAREPETEATRITALNDMCQAYLSKERPTEALQAASRAADLAATSFGQDNPITARSMFLQGLAYVQGNEPEQAKKYLDTGLTVLKAKLPAGHPEISLTLYQLGLCAIMQKDLEQAQSYCDQAATVTPASADNVSVSECKQAFADYFWHHGEFLGGFRMGGWKVVTRHMPRLATPVGRISKSVLPIKQGQSGPAESLSINNMALLAGLVLVPLVAVGLFVYLTMHIKLFEASSEGGSIFGILKHKHSKYTPRGYNLLRPVDKPAQTILDKHRGRTSDPRMSREMTITTSKEQ
jgi:tetratricopeptide (TPR) repeat protein